MLDVTGVSPNSLQLPNPDLSNVYEILSNALTRPTRESCAYDIPVFSASHNLSHHSTVIYAWFGWPLFEKVSLMKRLTRTREKRGKTPDVGFPYLQCLATRPPFDIVSPQSQYADVTSFEFWSLERRPITKLRCSYACLVRLGEADRPGWREAGKQTRSKEPWIGRRPGRGQQLPKESSVYMVVCSGGRDGGGDGVVCYAVAVIL